MILILFLILGFISITFEHKNSTISGYLPKNKIKSVYENGKTYYLDISEYSSDNDIEVNVTVYSGHFIEDIIFYGPSDYRIATETIRPIPHNWSYTFFEEGNKIDSPQFLSLLDKSEYDLKIINFDPLFYRFYLYHKNSFTKNELNFFFHIMII